MCAESFPKKITEQAFEYFDYLANLTSDWECTGPNNVNRPFTSTSTQHLGNKYQFTVEDDLNAKLTTLSKQMEALALAKVATNLPKETSIMCARYDTMDHCIDVCPVVAG